MDSRSLEMLVEEIFERAGWYGGAGQANRVAELFAYGWVCGAHELDREAAEQLRGALNRELARKDQHAAAQSLIQSAILNVN